MVADKGSFKIFLDNMGKFTNQDTIVANISKTSKEITQIEQDLSELVQLKLRKQIYDKYYNKEKVEYIKESIGNGSEPLTEFDDSLFIALIDKVIIKSPKYFNFCNGSDPHAKIGSFLTYFFNLLKFFI